MEINKIEEIINGGLLGDASIRSDKDKYFTFQYVAKDKRFLEWLNVTLQNSGIKCWISKNNTELFGLGFYINTCPYPDFQSLRGKWYREQNDKIIKTFPRKLKITPTTLLFWYLGDGCLVRRKKDENRVPTIVLATNCFSKEDIHLLIQKLKELNLNFYPVEYTSGFTGNKCGYCLYSKVQDGTPFRFFKFIGLECPKEISGFSTGSKGIYHEEKFFKNKWPTEEDWIKILSNVKGLNKIIKTRRERLRMSKSKLAEMAGISPRHIRHLEFGDRNLGVYNFRKVLNTLRINASYMLKELRREG